LTDETPVTPAEAERRGVSTTVTKALTKTPTIGRKLAPIPDDYFTKVFQEKDV